MSPLARATATSSLRRADLLRDLRERVFRPRTGPDRVGVEVELIPVDAGSGAVLPLRAPPGRPSILGLLDAHGARRGWQPSTSPVGGAGYVLPGGGAVTLEPGGQIEYSSPALERVDALVDRLDDVVRPLVREAADRGVALVVRGLDPLNPVSTARLQLGSGRYRRMSAHYDRLGPAGRRMMRQSAALHVNVDFGPRPGERWAVANAAVPVWTALFANSPRAEGREAGHRSVRAAQWRTLDPSRTGLFPPGGDPAAGYLEFALGADAFLLGPASVGAEPLRRWLERGDLEPEGWRSHLTTLFPEVRPRGYLEIRCFDTQRPRWYAVPLVLTVGLLYDPGARRTAAELLPPPTVEALERAGRRGLADPGLARLALDTATVALEGAARLGPVVGGRSLEVARAFVDALTRRGRDPGHEPGDRA